MRDRRSYPNVRKHSSLSLSIRSLCETRSSSDISKSFICLRTCSPPSVASPLRSCIECKLPPYRVVRIPHASERACFRTVRKRKTLDNRHAVGDAAVLEPHLHQNASGEGRWSRTGSRVSKRAPSVRLDPLVRQPHRPRPPPANSELMRAQPGSPTSSACLAE